MAAIHPFLATIGVRPLSTDCVVRADLWLLWRDVREWGRDDADKSCRGEVDVDHPLKVARDYALQKPGAEATLFRLDNRRTT